MGTCVSSSSNIESVQSDCNPEIDPEELEEDDIDDSHKKLLMSAKNTYTISTSNKADDNIRIDAILSSLSAYHSANYLKKLIIGVLARNLDEETTETLQRIFSFIDQKNDNILDITEFTSLLTKTGLSAPDAREQAAIIINNITGKRCLRINSEQFTCSYIAKYLSSAHVIKTQYNILDVDNDGLLSANDLVATFPQLTHTHIISIINEVDLDGTGLINFADFKHAMKFEPAYVEEKKMEDEDEDKDEEKVNYHHEENPKLILNPNDDASAYIHYLEQIVYGFIREYTTKYDIFLPKEIQRMCYLLYHPNTLYLNIVTPAYKYLSIGVVPTETISRLKGKIEDVEGIPTKQQALRQMHIGKVLLDRLKIADYNLHNDEMLQLTVMMEHC